MGRPPLPHKLAMKKNKAKKALRTAQRQDQAQRRTKLLKDIMAASEDDNKTFHKLVQRNRRMVISSEALIFKEEMIFDEDKQRSEWADYFQALSSIDTQLDEKDTTMLHLIREKFQGTTATIPKLTCYDIECTIKSLNKGKAPDTDGISAEHLQFAPMECISALTDIINKIFMLGAVPSACKSGFKIPIPKKGKDCKLPSNHRGITITAIMGKVVEKITQYYTDETLLPKQNELQFGFTKGLSPIMATLCLTEAAATAKSSKTALLVGALDVQKAFDVVNHQKLKIKLHNDGVDSTSWRIIDSLYSDISEKVRWKGSYSQNFTVGKGVRQGAVLSTSLYKVYINDILNVLQTAGIGMYIGSVYIGTPTCADDQLLLATNPEDMQAMLGAVYKYSEDHLYNIHPEKSSVTSLIKDKTNSAMQKTYQLNTSTLPERESFTHLGLKWNSGKITPDVANKLMSARRTVYALMGSGLHGGNGLSPATSLKIINTYVIPRLLYGLEAVNLSAAQHDEIAAFHKDLLRRIQGLPRYTASEAIYLLIGTLPLEAEIDIRTLTLFGAISRSQNQTLKLMASRQLSMDNKLSWFYKARSIALKYGINIENMFETPWRKNTWKMYIQQTIKDYWVLKLLKGKLEKSTLGMLDVCYDDSLTPHPLWQACMSNPRHVPAAVTRAKLITGTYPTMAKKAQMGSNHQAECLLCGEDVEDTAHMLANCKELNDTREDGLLKLGQLGFTISNQMDMARSLLNGPSKNNLTKGNYIRIQNQLNALCHKLHHHHHNLLAIKGHSVN